MAGSSASERNIRKARPAEADTVRAVVLDAYRHYVPIIGAAPGPMLDDYAVRIAAGQAWVLEHGGAIAAILVLEEAADGLLLDNIAVRPDRQGQGLGGVLLDFAEAEAARRGFGGISLYTNALMHDNIAIYQKRGYAVFDRRTEKGFDRVYMRKRFGA
jgi:GNAT superfamily N-acetyltransferase